MLELEEKLQHSNSHFFKTKMAVIFATFFFSALLSPLLASTTSSTTINDNNPNKTIPEIKKENTYKPFFEIGGAKYWHQSSTAATVYDLFLPLLQTDDQLLFTDLRIFDRSGKQFEGNAHFGYRKMFETAKKMFGIYGAFDRKKTADQNFFNQLTFGFEYWKNHLFVGGNVYKPIGITRKPTPDISINPNQEFIWTRGMTKTQINIDQQCEKALGGVDAELGYEIIDNLTSYVGGYYFAGDDVKTVAGPKVRVTYDYAKPTGRILGALDGISIEAGTQYDKPRGFSGYVGIKFKIGLTRSERTSNLQGFAKHMVELVRRDQDIVHGRTNTPNVRTHTLSEAPIIPQDVIKRFNIKEGVKVSELIDILAFMLVSAQGDAPETYSKESIYLKCFYVSLAIKIAMQYIQDATQTVENYLANIAKGLWIVDKKIIEHPLITLINQQNASILGAPYVVPVVVNIATISDSLWRISLSINKEAVALSFEEPQKIKWSSEWFLEKINKLKVKVEDLPKRKIYQPAYSEGSNEGYCDPKSRLSFSSNPNYKQNFVDFSSQKEQEETKAPDKVTREEKDEPEEVEQHPEEVNKRHVVQEEQKEAVENIQWLYKVLLAGMDKLVGELFKPVAGSTGSRFLGKLSKAMFDGKPFSTKKTLIYLLLSSPELQEQLLTNLADPGKPPIYSNSGFANVFALAKLTSLTVDRIGKGEQVLSEEDFAETLTAFEQAYAYNILKFYFGSNFSVLAYMCAEGISQGIDYTGLNKMGGAWLAMLASELYIDTTIKGVSSFISYTGIDKAVNELLKNQASFDAFLNEAEVASSAWRWEKASEIDKKWFNGSGKWVGENAIYYFEKLIDNHITKKVAYGWEWVNDRIRPYDKSFREIRDQLIETNNELVGFTKDYIDSFYNPPPSLTPEQIYYADNSFINKTPLPYPVTAWQPQKGGN